MVCLPLDEVCHSWGGRYIPFSSHGGDSRRRAGFLVSSNRALISLAMD